MTRPIVGIGEILFDLLPAGPQLGGAPANFAYHVSRLGGNGCAISAIGKDALGENVKNILSQKKLAAIIPEIEYPTGVVEVSLDEKGIPTYNIIRDVAWDNVPYTLEMKAIAAKCQAVCFGTLAQRGEITKNTILSFLADTPTDCLKVYDINLRQNYYSKEIIEESLKHSDILKINDEEIVTVSNLMGLSSNFIEACRELISKYNLRLVILTKGADGSDVITADKVNTLAPIKGKVADTVGAGDAFTAAFVLSYVNGKGVEECHKIANALSSYVCTKVGAMPDYDESMKILTK